MSRLIQALRQSRARDKAMAIKGASTEGLVDSLTGKVVCGYAAIPDMKLAGMLRDVGVIISMGGQDNYTRSIRRLIFGQAIRIWLDGTYAYRNLEDLLSVSQIK